MSTPIPARAATCLLSDCDGVIVDSEPLADRVMTEVLEEAFARDDLGPRLQALFGNRITHIIATLEAQLGLPLAVARRQELERQIDDRVARAAPAMPGVYAVYAALGLPIGIVSNSARARLETCVHRAGLAELVGPHVYSADDVPRPKPAPDVYLHAAAGMGVAPANCIVVEDSLAGVRAARAAGMRVLGFLGGGHIPAAHRSVLLGAGASAVFSRMEELPAMLQAFPEPREMAEPDGRKP